MTANATVTCADESANIVEAFEEPPPVDDK